MCLCIFTLFWELIVLFSFFSVSQGELPSICGLPHNNNIMELTSSEHLGQINDRRNSTTSTMSSAYTVSRRSSVVSPYLSNQRPGEVGNMVDSYDQPSSDTSRHSNTNGLPGLTPAQQYRLKAKYAAATGGPPPTPLPNMERMSANNRMAFAVGDYCGSSISSALSNNIQRRHSNNEYHSYGTGIIHPSQVPGAGIRRASDPARPSGDPQVIPKVQRFKSMSNMNTSMMGRQTLGHQQPYGGSDVNLQRHIFSPRPPSISENVFMETASTDLPSQNKEHNVMAGNEMQNYMNYPGQGSQMTTNTHMNFNHQLHGSKMQNQNAYSNSQRTLGGVHMNTNNHFCQSNVLSHSDLNQCQMTAHNQPFQNTRQITGNSTLPVQWHEVSSATMDMSDGQSANHQVVSPGSHCHNQYLSPETTKQVSLANSNSCQQQGMYVHNERYNHLGQVQIKPEQQFHQSMPSMMSCQNMKQHSMQQHAFSQSNAVALTPGNSNCDYQGQPENQPNPCYNAGLNPNMLSPQGRRSQTPMMQVKEMMVRNYVQSQQALMWEQQPKSMSMVNSSGEDVDTGQNQHRNTPHAPAYMSPKYINYQSKHPQNNLLSPTPHDNQAIHSKTMRSPGNQSYSVDMVPHPPCGPKPLSRQHSMTSQSTYMGSPTQLSPSYHSDESSPRRMPALPPIHSQSDSSDTTGMMYYSGQVEMHHGKTVNQKLATALSHPQSSCDGHQHGQYSSNLGFVKPDTIPYSIPCPASNPLDSLDLENTQIDFAAIIDDTDHTSLMPHNLTQSGLPVSSQPSSHLSTPRNPTAMVPNMAVSDLNSMLSSLAGENKFLNTIS